MNECDDFCLGPPCRHFPDWVKTAEDARDYLAYKALMSPPCVEYIQRAHLSERPPE